MTNAQAAAWYGAKPPDERATIKIINGDTCVIDEESLTASEDLTDDLDDYEGPKPTNGEPIVYQKW